MYDAKGNITRAGAEEVIRTGGTVHLRGKEYRTLQSLPTEAEFAVGDPEATQKALDGISAQRAALDEQERKLHADNAKVAQAKKDAEAAQKERERREKDNPQPPQALHQQFGGRPLSGAENPLAAEEANAAATAAANAAVRTAQYRQRQGTGTAVADEGEEEHFAGKPLSAYDGVPDDQLEQQDGVGAATADKIAKARRARDRKGAR